MFKENRLRICLTIVFLIEIIKRDVNAIYSGTFVQEGTFKFMTYLTHNGQYQCGAVILDELHLVTPAQCVKRTGTFKHEYEIVSDTLSTVKRKGIKNHLLHIYPHPKFKIIAGLAHNDVAILTLRQPLNLNRPNAKHAAIAMGQAYQIPKQNSMTTLIGWGAASDESIEIYGRLKYLNLRMSDQDQCRETASELWNLGTSHFCVFHGWEVERHIYGGASRGDYGSALVFGNTLVGIVTKPTIDIRTDKPDIYTNVGIFNYFYKDVLKKESQITHPPPPLPSCSTQPVRFNTDITFNCNLNEFLCIVQYQQIMQRWRNQRSQSFDASQIPQRQDGSNDRQNDQQNSESRHQNIRPSPSNPELHQQQQQIRPPQPYSEQQQQYIRPPPPYPEQQQQYIRPPPPYPEQQQQYSGQASQYQNWDINQPSTSKREGSPSDSFRSAKKFCVRYEYLNRNEAGQFEIQPEVYGTVAQLNRVQESELPSVRCENIAEPTSEFYQYFQRESLQTPIPSTSTVQQQYHSPNESDEDDELRKLLDSDIQPLSPVPEFSPPQSPDRNL